MPLRFPLAPLAIVLLGMSATSLWLGACSSAQSGVVASGGAEALSGGAAGAGMMSSGAGALPAPGEGGGGAAAIQTSGAAGTAAASGSPAAGGSPGGASGGTTAGGGMGPAGEPSGGRAAGGSAGQGVAGGGVAGSGNAAGGPPANCNLSNPVSFQKDVQGFLTTSCGKAVTGGCHVTDTSKTNLGFDHAYDWITAIAHTGSCGKTPPYAKRFEVVLDVINAANPPSCPNSRKMPPPGMGTPLTTCQIAALQAWLVEPMVSQMHVKESDETAALYPAGPYLMPPFN